MKPLVALDIETTGLDPTRDSIIEIGAVRFKGHRVEDKWQTLINPGRKLPSFITQLTGIHDAMLSGAPRLERVIPELKAFVGDLPVVGHNVEFDLNFLRRQAGLFSRHEALDTYDLASVLMPAAGRYNLGALQRALDIPLPASHRALDDALVTQAVFSKLFDAACELPLETLTEIVNLGLGLRWGAGWVFAEALRARGSEKARPRRGGTVPGGALFDSEIEAGVKPLRPVESPQSLDADELAGCLGPSGPFVRALPNYEHRPQQIDMMRAVCRAFNQEEHLLVEAGTGTGKSLAYLLPAARWALQNGERVVISTNTINLQDQLVNKDIPDLRNVLGWPVQAAVVKGRGQYICPRRLDNMRRRKPQTADEMRLLAKLLVWLPGSESGDRAEITLSGPGERQVWGRLSAEDEGCTADVCAQKTGGACPYFRAHRAAQSAHLIIVNHALLLADIASENRVLPEYRYLVIDEAHHLEAATTDGLSFRANRAEVDRRLRELGSTRGGLFGQIVAATSNALPPDVFGRLHREIERATANGATASALAEQFFARVTEFVDEQSAGQARNEYTQQVRVVASTRRQAHWEMVEMGWHDLRQVLAPLAEDLARLARGLNELAEYEIEAMEDLTSSATSSTRFFSELVSNLDGLVTKPDPNKIYWVELHPDGERVSLHAAPLHIGSLVEKHLWNAKRSVVLTSATLTTAGEFDYLKGRLNADGTRELAVGSPFDYQSSTLLYLVSDVPEPGDRLGFQKSVETGLIELCKASRGRALVLFTSYAQLKQTAQRITDPLAQAGITVLSQDEGGSRHNLLEHFRTADRAVLMGTRSFWEGVDVPGEALSVLVIVKLPFDVPSDPIVAARAETFENAFNDYNLPEAILRFRQGFGRLIRSKTDRGVVAIFDRRIHTKAYGRSFLDSLPACTVRRRPLNELPAATAKWLKGRDE